MRAVRIRVALVFIIAFAVYATGRLVGMEYAVFQATPASEPDSITAYVARFDTLKTLLPPQAIVQYVNLEGEGYRAFWFHHAATQYALAPILIDSTRGANEIVVTFLPGDTARLHQYVAAESLTVQRVFNGGAALLRRTSAP